jgi:hypothetical protein
MGSYRIGVAIFLGRNLNSSSAVGTALLITQRQFAKLFEFCTWASAHEHDFWGAGEGNRTPVSSLRRHKWLFTRRECNVDAFDRPSGTGPLRGINKSLLSTRAEEGAGENISRRDGAIVAWHEVPGPAPPKRVVP